MDKKSVTPSIRMSEEEYLKLKALKEEYGVSWNEFIAYMNKLIEKDMKKMDTDEKYFKIAEQKIVGE